MIPIFTYHAISPADGLYGQDFYTVTREQLERHFNALAAAGRQCLSFAELRQPKSLPVQNFLLTFDDATADHAEIVAPMLNKRGWTGTFFVPTAKLNRPGYLTGDQVRELSRSGHTVGLHSHEHRRLDLATDDEMREQFSRSQQIIGDLVGGKPGCFAPPGGFMNEHVREVALGFGVEAIRTMRWGYNQKVELTALETIPINRYTDEEKFQRLLAARQTRSLYFGKQAMKSLIPARAYETLRNLAFKISGRS